MPSLKQAACILALTKINKHKLVPKQLFLKETRYAWGAPHLGVGTGRSIATPTRVAALQKHNVQGVAPGEWQSLAWVGPKSLAPPLAPGLAPAWGPIPDSARMSIMNGGGGDDSVPEINVDSSSAPTVATTSSEPSPGPCMCCSVYFIIISVLMFVYSKGITSDTQTRKQVGPQEAKHRSPSS